MAEYTPTESALIAAAIGTGPLLSAREAQESIARIKAAAWREGNRHGFALHCDKKDEGCFPEPDDNPYEQDGETT